MSCWQNRRCFPKAAPHKYASGVGEAKSDDFTVKSCQIFGHLSGDPLHPLMHNCKALPFAILMADAFCGPTANYVGRRNTRGSGRFRCRNGALGKRFDAYPWRQPVTESSYINSLANRPYRSTIKTLPATLPEPWTTVRGPGSRHIGPWSTDLEPWIGGLESRIGVTGAG